MYSWYVICEQYDTRNYLTYLERLLLMSVNNLASRIRVTVPACDSALSSYSSPPSVETTVAAAADSHAIAGVDQDDRQLFVGASNFFEVCSHVSQMQSITTKAGTLTSAPLQDVHCVKNINHLRNGVDKEAESILSHYNRSPLWRLERYIEQELTNFISVLTDDDDDYDDANDGHTEYATTSTCTPHPVSIDHSHELGARRKAHNLSALMAVKDLMSC